MSRLRYGVGINDANYTVHPTENGKTVSCKYYKAWSGMLDRCYSEEFLKRKPTYRGCYVCSEWLSFMNFKSWMETQDWEGKELDKDLLVKGNKMYGPDTCLFVSSAVNLFLTKSDGIRGNCSIGVSMTKGGRYKASIRNLGRGKLYLGTFDTQEEASNAYKIMKSALAKELASQQQDIRVAEALISTTWGD